MKKIINDVDLIIDQMIDGLVKANDKILKRLDDSTVVARKGPAKEGKVGIISGGGAATSQPTQAMSEKGCSIVPYAVASSPPLPQIKS